MQVELKLNQQNLTVKNRKKEEFMAVQAAAEPGAHSIKWTINISSKQENPSILLLFNVPKVSETIQTVKQRLFDLVGTMSPANRQIFTDAFANFESYEQTLKQKGMDDELAAVQQQWKAEFTGHTVYREKSSYATELFLRVDYVARAWFLTGKDKLTAQNAELFLRTHASSVAQVLRREAVQEMAKLCSEEVNDVKAEEHGAPQERLERKALPASADDSKKVGS